MHAHGISNLDADTTLSASSVNALAEYGSLNYGLHNSSGAEATVSSGSFSGYGGAGTYGVYTVDSGTTLFTTSITALADLGSDFNYGLHNDDGAEAALRGGSYTGRGGIGATGINNHAGSTLFAANVAALGENASMCEGFDNSGLATLRGGSFAGRSGAIVHGIYNVGTLEADHVTVVGRDGGSSSYGLYNGGSGTTTANSSQFIGSSNGLDQQGGTVHLGVSQLDGGANLSGGTLTCFQVYDGNYVAYTCP